MPSADEFYTTMGVLTQEMLDENMKIMEPDSVIKVNQLRFRLNPNSIIGLLTTLAGTPGVVLPLRIMHEESSESLCFEGHVINGLSKNFLLSLLLSLSLPGDWAVVYGWVIKGLGISSCGCVIG